MKYLTPMNPRIPRDTFCVLDVATKPASASLADVVAALENEGLGYRPGSRETVLRALRRHGRILTRRLETIAACPETLARENSLIAWSSCGFVTQAAFRQHCAKVVGAARRLTGQTAPSAPVSNPTWQRVAEAIALLNLSKGDTIMLRARWASLTRLSLQFDVAEPSELSSVRVQDICRLLPMHARQTWRRDLHAFNMLIKMREAHGALVGLPRDPVAVPHVRTRLDWDCLPETFRTEVDGILDRLAAGRGPGEIKCSAGGLRLLDIVMDRSARPFKPQRQQTLDNARWAIGWLVNGQLEARGRDPAELTSLAELCAPLPVVHAVEAQMLRQTKCDTLNDRSAGPYQRASIIFRIATRFFPIDDSNSRERWQRLLAALSKDRDIGKIATKHRVLLEQLIRSPDMQRRWLTLDRRAWEEAEILRRRPNRSAAQTRKMLQLAEFAVLITILVRTLPTRLSTLPAITFRGENPLLKLPRTRREKAFLDIPAGLVKNDERLFVDVPPESLDIIAGYIAHYRPLVLEMKGFADSDHLFPGLSNGGSRSVSAIAMIIKNGCAAFGFQGVTTHVARHFAAQLVLEADPGAIGAAAEWLGDTQRTVSTHYTISNARGAARRSRELLFGGPNDKRR